MSTTPLSHLIPPGMVAQQMPRPPTAEQIAEVQLVRDLQIRTEAIRLAIAAAGGDRIAPVGLLRVAADIERYLKTGLVEPAS